LLFVVIAVFPKQLPSSHHTPIPLFHTTAKAPRRLHQKVHVRRTERRKRKAAWVEDEYYNGQGLGKREQGPAANFPQRRSFLVRWLHRRLVPLCNDSLAVQFLCAMTVWTTITIHWNHFCSCHETTEECDGGGGCLKRALDTIVITGGKFFDRALGIVLAWPGEGTRVGYGDVQLDNPQEQIEKGDRQFLAN
jgi:hypothetical protein